MSQNAPEKLFRNAIVSLRMGVADYNSAEDGRELSAVRNFYAGILLLAKEILSRSAPLADLDEVLGAKYKPVPDGSGSVEYVMDGHKTIDFSMLQKRFKDFGMALPDAELRDLQRIRNDVEHLFTDEPENVVKDAIANAFPLISHLFRLADENPADVLGDAWPVMLETRELYKRELGECRATLTAVNWYSRTVADAPFTCQHCKSGLIQQEDSSNSDQDQARLICRRCGEESDTQAIVLEALGDALSRMAYERVKDEGTSGPIHICPECYEEGLVDFEGACAACGESPSITVCSLCEESFAFSDLAYLEGDLCSYCQYKTDKIMRDD